MKNKYKTGRKVYICHEKEKILMNYDVIIIGAGPGGIFAAYELMKKKPECKIAVFEEGYPLEKRKCPIDGEKLRTVSIVNDVRSCAASGSRSIF